MIKYIATTALTLQIFSAVHTFQNSVPIPVNFNENSQLTRTREALFLLGRDQKFAKPIYYSAKANDIDPVLWACLTETESEYNIKAKSSKGYKGLSQTPKAIMRTGFEAVDLTYGSCILREKLQIANGDLKKALTFYKGSSSLTDKKGRDTLGHKQAKEVLTLYSQITKQIERKES